jgi:hypothetical protein
VYSEWSHGFTDLRTSELSERVAALIHRLTRASSSGR